MTGRFPYRWVTGSLTLLVLSLTILISWSEADSTRRQRPTLPMHFAHADHTGESCIACHHNFVDGTGFKAPCLRCHETDVTVAHLREQQFHELCRGCHQQRAIAGQPGGPTRACRHCHEADDEP